MEREHHVPQKLRPLEPPVTKQLRVERRDHRAMPPGTAAVLAETVLDGVDEVLGVFVDLARDVVGLVEVLIAQIDLVAR